MSVQETSTPELMTAQTVKSQVLIEKPRSWNFTKNRVGCEYDTAASFRRDNVYMPSVVKMKRMYRM
jgi:hypothetical protein